MPVDPYPKTSPQQAIAKTRQLDAPIPGPARGILTPVGPPGGQFLHRRLAPPLSLAPWVQHFWMVQWDLRDVGPRLQETLPHPNTYLLFEQNLEHPLTQPLPTMAAELSGVSTGKFSRRLEGWGRVFGVKFKPGGLRPFLAAPISTLTNAVQPAHQLLGPAVLDLAAQIYRSPDPESMADLASHFLASLNPKPDPSADLSAQLVQLIFDEPAILTVDQLATRTGMGTRTLQRLFREYVGVPPKWVIRRYRLHELVERLHSGQTFDGAQLALDLGYADQAHLINDFRNLVGYTPTTYSKRATTRPQPSISTSSPHL